jgi:hypothetical protein
VALITSMPASSMLTSYKAFLLILRLQPSARPDVDHHGVGPGIYFLDSTREPIVATFTIVSSCVANFPREGCFWLAEFPKHCFAELGKAHKTV